MFGLHLTNSLFKYWRRKKHCTSIIDLKKVNNTYISICLHFQKETLMEHVAYQTIVMQFILELSKHMKKDPRDCVQAFFNR